MSERSEKELIRRIAGIADKIDDHAVKIAELDRQLREEHEQLKLTLAERDRLVRDLGLENPVLPEEPF